VTLFAGHVVFDEVGVLETHEFNGEAIFDMADNAALRLADGNDDADARAVTPMAAPDCERSITRHATFVPFGKTSRATVFRGVKPSWRRSSGKLRICRLASQVSCDASLSRLRSVAEMIIAKPFSITRAILPSSLPR
jgi:hypothetical protein